MKTNLVLLLAAGLTACNSPATAGSAGRAVQVEIQTDDGRTLPLYPAPHRGSGNRVYAALAGVAALVGVGLAARHVWLQYNPPQFASCAGDLYSQIERLPLGRVIANAIRATGDCAKVDWTMLHFSIAEWSLIWFAIFSIGALALLGRRRP